MFCLSGVSDLFGDMFRYLYWQLVGLFIKKRNQNNWQKVDIPLIITVIILTTLILIGALIFDQFETWNTINAAYVKILFFNFQYLKE